MAGEMTCPFCGKRMQRGIMSGDGRSGVFWKAGGGRVTLAERITGTGRITATRYTPAKFSMEAHFCAPCGKMIIETDVKR